jgi:hypothetical protein
MHDVLAWTDEVWKVTPGLQNWICALPVVGLAQFTDALGTCRRVASSGVAGSLQNTLVTVVGHCGTRFEDHHSFS